MFRFLIFLSLVFLPTIALSQAPATVEVKTPDGRTVLLKSNGTWEYKKDLPPPAANQSAPANSSASNLSPNYSGHDPAKLLVQLVDLSKRLVKSEFETTAEYEKRAAQEKKQPILGDLTIQDTFHLVSSGVEADYDADTQTMTLFLPVEKNGLAEAYRRLRMETKTRISDLSMRSLYQISLSGRRGYNVFFDELGGLPLAEKDYKSGFSMSVAMSVDDAKRIKASTKALLIVQFEDPFAIEGYSSNGQLQVRLLNVEFFDPQTGKILAKIGQ